MRTQIIKVLGVGSRRRRERAGQVARTELHRYAVEQWSRRWRASRDSAGRGRRGAAKFDLRPDVYAGLDRRQADAAAPGRGAGVAAARRRGRHDSLRLRRCERDSAAATGSQKLKPREIASSARACAFWIDLSGRRVYLIAIRGPRSAYYKLKAQFSRITRRETCFTDAATPRTPTDAPPTQNDPHKLRRLRRPTGPQRAALC